MKNEKTNIDQVHDRFLRDIENHSMEILLDSGLHRHLKFTNNGSSVYRFDLITWTGYLCLCGDMGDYVFTRIPDMFNFFTHDNEDGELRINPSYWTQKCEADCTRGGRTKEGNFSFLKEAIKKQYEEFMEEYGKYDDGLELWDEIKWQVIKRGEDYSNDDIMIAISMDAAYNFVYTFDDARIPDFQFDTMRLSEYGLEDYSYHYIWCLYAIVWGIQKYKQSKKEAA